MQWMSTLCSQFSGWNGAFPFIDRVVYWAVDQAPIADYPNCTVGTGCSQAVNQTLYEQNTTLRCQSASNCTYPTEAWNWPEFCKSIQYGQTCSNSCHHWWERGELANWMYTTCSMVDQWTGLPADWRHLYYPLREDLIPWHWNLSWSPPSQKSGTSTKRAAETPARPHCPSTGAKLGAFAAVNNAMAIIMPILGRRSVIFFVMFGLLGKPDMLLWWISGILTLCFACLEQCSQRNFDPANTGICISQCWTIDPTLVYKTKACVDGDALSHAFGCRTNDVYRRCCIHFIRRSHTAASLGLLASSCSYYSNNSANKSVAWVLQ